MRNANPEIVPLIKDKALELLMKQNPDTIGMRDIARECGITAANIYHYYSDKDALFQQIALDCLHDLNESLVAASKTTRNPKKKLSAQSMHTATGAFKIRERRSSSCRE